MTKPARKPARTTRVLSLTATLTFATLGMPAFAQGTKAQREACAPDAINLCSDTIPDVGRTEACMRRHFNQLSPACKTAFNDATGSEPNAAPRREERDARAEPYSRGRAERPDGYPEDDIPGVRQYGYEPPQYDDGLETSRNVISQLCSEGMIDPGTCRRTARALDMR